MARNVQTIRIESILGGQAPLSHMQAPDQFTSSIGVDPVLNYRSAAYPGSGILNPTGSVTISGTNITKYPLWMVTDAKVGETYVYATNGSVYTKIGSGVGDLNDGGTAKANGCEYYDNYMYFARDTTVARYGPIDGTPVWTDDYWVATLGKAALNDVNNNGYVGDIVGERVPNHIMKRHSDGKLYFADMVGGQGALHYIKTSKTTVEGDTDNGSTYGKLYLGYGLSITAIESYGNVLVLALMEGDGNLNMVVSAKVAFWDTTSENINQIVWNEFPDDMITGLKNINGTLYVISCIRNRTGFRVSRYIGGNSFETLAFHDNSEPPFPGGIANIGGRLMWGSYAFDPTSSGVVYSLGLGKEGLQTGIFAPYMSVSTSATVTALVEAPNQAFGKRSPYMGWTNGSSGGGSNGVDQISSTITNDNGPVWWSQVYKIGLPFKILKIRLPLAKAVSLSTSIYVGVYIDDVFFDYKAVGPAITNSTYPGKYHVTLMPQNLTGEHSFMLEINWVGPSSSSAINSVGLPITIEYELLDD